jgi:hypothetical protein
MRHCSKCFAYPPTVKPEALKDVLPYFIKRLPALGAIRQLDRVLQREYRKRGLTTEEIDNVRIRQGNMFHMANLAVYIFFRQ